MSASDAVEQLVATVLYEGYVLWPYRRSARKNQQRWTFGGIYPRAFAETSPADPWRMQTQCLVTGSSPRVAVRVRFLHVVERQVARRNPGGTLDFVDELRVDGERYLSWEETAEREVALEGLALAAPHSSWQTAIAVPAGRVEEPLLGFAGERVGALVRSWRSLSGTVEVRAERVGGDLFRLTVEIVNTTPWSGSSRPETLRQTLVSTHTLLAVQSGEFVSLMDPPEALKAPAEACQNQHTWPVLVGEEGTRHTMLSSPIILYDYPRIAPESRGDFFDGTEIDQMLLLNVLTLTDEEKAEMRASDPRARAILERSESLTAQDFMRLNGTIRDFQVLREPPHVPPDVAVPREPSRVSPIPAGPPVAPDVASPFAALERPVPAGVTVDGVTLQKGSRVRLRPGRGRDVWDSVLSGKVARVESLEQDYEDRVYLAVTLDDDPGRDLGEARFMGHLFFFSPDEVEPLGQEGEPMSQKIEPLGQEGEPMSQKIEPLSEAIESLGRNGAPSA
ncbi:MAG: hypothetical protein M3442_13650 [Chloroflexota bacterium]|nr:hypothetical protein [Chloroflexota bacterium]